QPPSSGRLAFITQPPAIVEGTVPLAPAVRIAIQDAGGNTIVDATNAVTVALTATPRGGTLSGTTTENAVAGVATFSDLGVDRPRGGYTLVAQARDFASGGWTAAALRQSVRSTAGAATTSGSSATAIRPTKRCRYRSRVRTCSRHTVRASCMRAAW